jgi:hypothetical protein
MIPYLQEILRKIFAELMLARIINENEYIVLAKHIIHYRGLGNQTETFGFESFWKIIQIYDHKKFFDLFLGYLVKD